VEPDHKGCEAQLCAAAPLLEQARFVSVTMTSLCLVDLLDDHPPAFHVRDRARSSPAIRFIRTSPARVFRPPISAGIPPAGQHGRCGAASRFARSSCKCSDDSALFADAVVRFGDVSDPASPARLRRGAWPRAQVPGKTLHLAKVV